MAVNSPIQTGGQTGGHGGYSPTQTGGHGGYSPTIDFFSVINVDISHLIFERLDLLDQCELHQVFGEPCPSQFSVAKALLQREYMRRFGHTQRYHTKDSMTLKGTTAGREVFSRQNNIPLELYMWEELMEDMRLEALLTCPIEQNRIFMLELIANTPKKEEPSEETIFNWDCHPYHRYDCDERYMSDTEEEYAYASAMGIKNRFPSSYTSGDEYFDF
jgi:hypothetical protein